MTEEEKKAIEYLIEEIKSLEKVKIEFSNEIEDKGWLLKNINELDKDLFYINTLLNLIKKLQNENERQQDIIIEKDRQLHLMHKEIQSVREQAWEITDKSLKDLLMLNTPKIIIESKEDIKGLLDNYISKGKIREKIEKIEDEIKIDKELWYVCEVKDIDIKRHEVKILQELLEED